MEVVTKDIANLLENVNLIKKKYDEILDATGGRFNIFRSCGVNHYENTHSAILAEFLKTDGTHGLKSRLLESFIENLDEDFNIQNFNFDNSRVYKEYCIPEKGRIDILIEDNQNKAIIIENKIYAGDQWEQLKRYERFAINKYGEDNFQILYLSLYGKDASEQSSKDVLYFPISYETTIINWLEKCVAIASRFPMVRETIIQYINHLKELTNQSIYNDMRQEIKNIIFKNEDNLQIAKEIVETLNSVSKEKLNLLGELVQISVEDKLKMDNKIKEVFPNGYVRILKSFPNGNTRVMRFDIVQNPETERTNVIAIEPTVQARQGYRIYNNFWASDKDLQNKIDAELHDKLFFSYDINATKNEILENIMNQIEIIIEVLKRSSTILKF